MRAVLQRVKWAQVEVGPKVVARIERGLVVYVGVGVEDDESDAKWLAEKVANLRIFDDRQGKLNLSVRDAGGGILAISNFTLMGDGRRGRRPSFVAAARPEQAAPLHEAFVKAARQQGMPVEVGVFGTHMYVASQADGPVNIVLDSPSTAPSARQKEAQNPDDTE